MRVLLDKVKEVLFCVLPITLIVLLLHFTLTPLPYVLLARFLLGALFVVIGLSILLFGIDIGISPLGNSIGSMLSKSNRVWILVLVALVIGFFVSVAEPDLQILASQIGAVTEGLISNISILLVVSAGIAVMLTLGLLRITFNLSISIMLAAVYGIIGVLSIFVSPEFLAMAFDASGATTGALTVPFILALAVGVSVMKKDSAASEEDSFGLVAVTSTGAILGVLAMGIVRNVTGLTGTLPASSHGEESVFLPFLSEIIGLALESMIALLPLIVIFFVLQIFSFKFKKRKVLRILKGFLYTYIGFTLFLTGVNAGFMEAGSTIGVKIALLDSKIYAIIVEFVIGCVTILAEPAVHVLTDQVETVTSGFIKPKIVYVALSIGVGFAIVLSILRILLPSIQLWHYLLPGFAVCIALSFFVPKIYVGIAFDSGGVASGPMTATFILAFTQGVAESTPTANVLTDAFGMIAMVAMTPIITLQLLGLIVKVKDWKRKRMVKENA